MVYLNQTAAKFGGTYAVQYIAGAMIRSQYEGVKTLSTDKTILERYEAILTNDNAERQRLAADGRLIEAVSCRTWSLFIPLP